MADPNSTQGAPPRSIHIDRKPVNWLAWIALAAGIIALIFALARHQRPEAVATAPAAPVVAQPAAGTPPVAVERVTLPGGKIVALAPATLTYDLQRYLASGAPIPRTFTFDRLNFATASAAIRAEDRATLDALTQILAAYPKATVRLVGYADARGTAGANAALGAQRAQAVVKTLTDGGIAPARLSAASGGETNPIGSNATAGGQLENRRTDLVVTAK